MSDAASEFLKTFDDPTRYVVKRRVPILYAHDKDITDPDTGKRVTKTITDADLDEWLEQMQAAERANGVAGVLRIGHIRQDAPETDQPPVGGYLRNPVLGRFGPRQRLGILVDEYAKAERVEQLKDAPRRSVEMYRPRKLITAVAALTRDPQLPDLGYVTYSRAGERLECYSLGDPAMDPMTDPAAAPAAPTPPAAPAGIDEATMASIIAAVVKAVMEQIKGAKPEPEPEPDPLNKPSPTPGKAGDKDKEITAMSADQKAELYALQSEVSKQKRINDANAAKLAALEKERDEARVEKFLAELSAENYSFDAAEERAALLELPTEDARRKYLARVRKNYQQMPAGRLEVYAGPSEPGTGGIAERQKETERTKKAFALLNANPGMTLEQALAKVA